MLQALVSQLVEEGKVFLDKLVAVEGYPFSAKKKEQYVKLAAKPPTSQEWLNTYLVFKKGFDEDTRLGGILENSVK